MSNFVNLKFKHKLLIILQKQFVFCILTLLLASFSVLGQDDIFSSISTSEVDKRSHLIIPKIEGGIPIKILYSTRKVNEYKDKLNDLFPNVKFNPPQSPSAVPIAEIPISKVEMQEISCRHGSLQEQIMYTEGIMDSVVITLFNLENNLMFMYPHIWEKHLYELQGSKKEAKRASKEQGFSELKKKLDELERQLPSFYKDKTEVALVTYYLSENLFQLGVFLKKRGFKLGTIYSRDAAIDIDNNIYFDPNQIEIDSGVPRTKTGQKLLPRNVSLSHTGTITIDSSPKFPSK